MDDKALSGRRSVARDMPLTCGFMVGLPGFEPGTS